MLRALFTVGEGRGDEGNQPLEDGAELLGEAAEVVRDRRPPGQGTPSSLGGPEQSKRPLRTRVGSFRSRARFRTDRHSLDVMGTTAGLYPADESGSVIPTVRQRRMLSGISERLGELRSRRVF